MKCFRIIFFTLIILLAGCSTPVKKNSGFSAISQVKTGRPVSVMLTSYSTTLIANGKDQTRLRIAVTDSSNREITSATDSIRVYVTGDGKVTTPDGKEIVTRTDTAGKNYTACRLADGICRLLFIAGNHPDKIKVEAKSGNLWPGSHEIHTLPADFRMMKPLPEQLTATTKNISRMIGADISFLPQIEDRGIKFSDQGKEKDAILLLHDHGFNTIRLRIFVNPGNEKGYSPGKGYCGLQETLIMAKRVHETGIKLLLDFHYSDYWADPQQQNKPLAWNGLDFNTLKDSVKSYTTKVLLAFKRQGTLPDMVQIGNEVNHGILWPDGHISHPEHLAELLTAGVEGVKAADPGIPVMMHIALGGQNDEAVFWLDNMIARGVKFDVIGLSYYPRWHGTLDDLEANINALADRYHKPLIIVEYSDFKCEVNDIAFSLPNDMGKGTCIWEPLGWGSRLFDKKGRTTGLINIYYELKKKYLSQSISTR